MHHHEIMERVGERRRPSPRRLEATLRRRRVVTDRIQLAALELMADSGYHAVTVEDIAAAAGVSARTFFRHFACKDDVVLHLQRQALEVVCAAVARRPAGEAAHLALRRAIVDVSAVTESERRLVLLHARVLAGVPALQAQAMGECCAGTGSLVAALAGRLGCDPAVDVRPALLAATVTAAAGVAFTRWAAAGGVGDPSTSVAAAVDAVLGGVGSLASA